MREWLEIYLDMLKSFGLFLLDMIKVALNLLVVLVAAIWPFHLGK